MPESPWILKALDPDATPAGPWEIGPAGLTLGRSPDCTIPLDPERHPGVSSFHARLTLVDGEVRLDDLDSSNGTWVGAERVTRRSLPSGAVFELGRSGPRFAVWRETADARRTAILSRGPRRRAPIGVETVQLLKRELGIEGDVDSMLRARSRVNQARTRRARSKAIAGAAVIVAGLAVALWLVSRRAETLASELERTLQERLARTRADLTSWLTGYRTERDRAVDRGRDLEAERQVLEERRRDLEEHLEALRREGEGQRDELARMAAHLEATSRELRRFDPVNLEQEKLRRVRAVERAVVLIEASARYLDPRTSKVLYVEETPGGANPNFDARGRELRNESSGSGFVIDARGHVLTNAHVVLEKGDDTARELGRALGLEPQVTLTATFSGTSRRIPVQLVRFLGDGDEDLALLRLEPFHGMPYLEGIDLDVPVPEVGSDVYLIGFPLGKRALQPDSHVAASTFRGILSRPVAPYLQVDAAVHPGASGGPLIDARGRLIGVVVGRQRIDERQATSAIGYVIPLAAVRRIWPST